MKKVTLGGAGGWDYLTADPVSHRLFISHATPVMVVDAEDKVVGDILNLQETHDGVPRVEFSPALPRAPEDPRSRPALVPAPFPLPMYSR